MRKIMLAGLCAAALATPAFAPFSFIPAAFAQSDAPPATHHGGGFMAKFQAANTTHDGHLTLDQAKAGNMPMLVAHFNDIDADHKGYITVDDMKAFHQKMKAQKAAAGGQ